MTKVHITKESSFIIYGGGEVGNICTRNLLERGYNVTAGLDKRKEGPNVIQGIYTYCLGVEQISLLEKENSIVVICLADGMLHKSVADDLYKRGYQNIVFLPMVHSICAGEKRRLTALYNRILDGSELCGEEDWIYPYSYYKNPQLESMNGVFGETEDSYIVYLRLEELFSESYELWKGDKSKVFVKLEHKDKSIMLHPYLSMFKYFLLEIPSCEAYFAASRIERSDDEKKKEIIKREKLYSIFKKELEKGMEFFLSAAPPVIRNPQNYYNLVGGHHRTLFLLSEGKTLFPVKMKKDDFVYWCNEESFIELRNFIYENEVESTYAPISHPAFLNFPSRSENFGETKLQAIIEFLEREKISKFSVLESEISEGYFSRFLLHAGALSANYISNDVNKRELVQKIAKLKYILEPEFMCRSWNETLGKAYDVVLALDFESMEDLLDIWNAVTRKYLFVEVADVSKLEDVLERTDFREIEIIHKEFREGIIKYLCILKK